MSRPTEEDFVNEGLTDDERASLSAEPQTQEPESSPEPTQQQAEPQQAQDEPKTVDVRALQEVRAKLRERDEEVARIRDERVRLEERLNILNQSIAQQQKQPEQPKAPSKDEDPLGFYDHKIQTLEQQLSRFNAAEQQRTQAAQAEQQFTDLTNRAGSVIAQAATADPKVNEALDFAFEGLRSEIRASVENAVSKGILAPHMQMAESERIWRASIATLAQRVTADPQQAADFVYRQARYYGWGVQPQQPAPVQQQTAPNPVELAARQERHMSLSNIQGGEAPQQLSLEAISKMSEDEFFKLAAKLGDKGLDKIYGAA